MCDHSQAIMTSLFYYRNVASCAYADSTPSVHLRVTNNTSQQ